MGLDARDIKIVKMQFFHKINLESNNGDIRGSQDPHFQSIIPLPSPQQSPGFHIEAI